MQSLAVKLISLMLVFALLMPSAASAAGLQTEEEDRSPVSGTQVQSGGGNLSGFTPDEDTLPGGGITGEDPEDAEPASVTVTFLDGDRELDRYSMPAGEVPYRVPAEDGEGNPVLGWTAGGRKVNVDAPAAEDTVFSVWHAPAVMTEHRPYVKGTAAGRFSPSDFLTRAEAAALLCGILADPEPGDLTASFPDVPADAWYCDSVLTLASLGVVGGRPDGTFGPGDWVSRAEFAVMVHSLFPMETEFPVSFPDVPEDHWARTVILSAAAKGWITGSEEGLFNPDGTLSRCEAVCVLNRVLNRRPAPETGEMLAAANAAPFTDVRPGVWYYADVMEAFLPHTFETEAEGEVWTGFDYVSCGAEPGLQHMDGALWTVDENRQVVFQNPGLYELDGGLWCVREDGAFLCDGKEGYLTFGSDGRYTCGDAECDAEVEKALAACTTPDMTREEKLRAAYLYVRDHCLYLGISHYPRGYSEDWYIPSALMLFRQGKGNCYCYAAAFTLMARRLGFQAYGVSGGYKSNNTDHAWVMIDEYVYDPCLEYLIPSLGQPYRWLYQVLPEETGLRYSFPPR